MNIMPISAIRNDNTFGAKVSNITIKDSAVESIKGLEEIIYKAGKNVKNSEIPIGNKKAIHSPYELGYHTKDRDLDFILDENNNVTHIGIINKTKTPDDKELIKSFYYYKGCPTAPNPIPSISYSEFTVFDFNTYKHDIYNEGEVVPDNIADKIKNLIDITIKNLGIK